MFDIDEFGLFHYYCSMKNRKIRKWIKQNVKKVLALVLAFACAFTMFAGAAFTDSADISQTEAVDMLTALGVIDGYEDGTFRPEATITRAEAAKMIFTIWNGGNDNASAFAGQSVFTDVYSGHWAEGYINFCYANGIVAGKSTTQFAPDDNVTGTELAKMLLICMGYQSDKSGLEGSAWEQKTNGLASQNGLYSNVTAAVGSAMPRQFAAQIMYNALNADTVTWSTDSNSYEKTKVTTLEWKDAPDGKVGSGSWVSVTKNETMGKRCMGLDTKEDILLYSVEQESGKDTYSLNGGMFKKVATDCSNLLGQVVNVMVKDDDTSKVYGVYADEDSTVVATGYAGQLEKSTDGKKIKLDGTEYKLDSDSATTGNAIYTANTDTYDVSYDTIINTVGTKGSMNKNAAASSIKLIDNDGDGKVDTALYTPVKVGKVTAVGTSSVSVNNGINTVKFDDADIYDGIAKDDYVMFVDEANRSSNDKDELTKLDVVSAKVTGTRSDSNDKVVEAKVNDEWIKLADADLVESGNTYDMVIVGGVMLFADETEATSKDILYISGTKAFDKFVGEDYGTVEARAYFTDGTNKTIKVSKYDGDKLTSSTASKVAEYDMYTFSLLSDDTYDIKKVDGDNKAGYDDYNTDADAYADQKIDGYAPLDDAVVFVQTKKETKVLTGKQIKNWADTIDNNPTFASTYLVNESNGINYVAVATLVDSDWDYSVPGATKDTLYAYLTADAYKGDKDGEDKATYEVWTVDGAQTLYADTTSVKSGATAGAVISYNVNGDYIENINVVGTKAAIVGFDYKSEGELSIVAQGQVGQYTLDEDCVFIAIDDENTAGEEGGMEQVILANPGDNSTSAKETVVTNAYVVIKNIDGKDKVVAVVFDVTNNELDSALELVKKTGDIWS